jgi:predicted nuclease with TOPRIM domain
MSDDTLEDYSSSDGAPELKDLEERLRKLRLDVAQLQADFDRLKDSVENNDSNYYNNDK